MFNTRNSSSVVVVINKATPITVFPTAFPNVEPPAIYVGGAGTITVKLAGDPSTEVTFTVVAGQTLQAHVHTVVSATATLLLAIW